MKILSYLKMSVPSDLFENYFLPISGIDFVRYVAIYSVLSDFGLRPKVIYSASGGCLASYLAMMSSFTKSVENWKFNSDMIFRKIPLGDPRVLTFVLNGYFYRRRNLIDYIRNNFIPKKLQDVEIITGFFENHENTQRINICTNYSKNTSSIKSFDESSFIGHNMTITYAPVVETKEDYEKLLSHISGSIHKTTNIPYVIEPLGKNKAIDFGIVAPSPRSILRADLRKSIYFSPIDIENIDIKSGYSTVFHHFILKDILSISENFPEIIEMKSGKQIPGKVYLNSIADVMNFINERCEAYCLVLYSRYNVDIKITSFKENEISDAMKNCKDTLSFKLFYKPNS